VINSNLCPTLHRFGDTVNLVEKSSKNANFYPPQSHKSPSLGVTPFEFRDEPDISLN